VSVIVDDNTILASVDFSYQVKVKKAGAEVLHFSNEREGLQPAGAFEEKGTDLFMGCRILSS